LSRHNSIPGIEIGDIVEGEIVRDEEKYFILLVEKIIAKDHEIPKIE